jgi:hypothetical protein
LEQQFLFLRIYNILHRTKFLSLHTKVEWVHIRTDVNYILSYNGFEHCKVKIEHMPVSNISTTRRLQSRPRLIALSYLNVVATRKF